MSKALTTPLIRTFNALAFIEKLGDEKNDEKNNLKIADEPVYIFASNIMPWLDEFNSLPDVETTEETYNSIKKNMLYVKHISKNNAHLVIPRHDWKSGTIYSEWRYDKNMLDPANWLSEKQPPFVFVETTNSDRRILSVFMCISNNANQISVTPPSVITHEIFNTADGYSWKYIYDIEVALYNEWASDKYIPIPHDESEMSERHKGVVEDYSKINKNSEFKNITQIKITNEGKGYKPNSNIYVVIEGDGLGATAKLTWEKIKKYDEETKQFVETNDQRPVINITNGGKGYTYAYANIICEDLNEDGLPIVESPMLTEVSINPVTFLGQNALHDLCPYHVSIKASFDGNEGDIDTEEEDIPTEYINNTLGGHFPTSAPYRRIGLIKNVKTIDGTDIYLKKPRYYDIIKLNNVSGNMNVLSTIKGIESLTKAQIWYAENINSYEMLLYVIGRTGNFKLFENDITKSEYIVDTNSNSTGRICDFIEKNVDQTSGEFLYIENVQPISRAIAQEEQFLFTIEF